VTMIALTGSPHHHCETVTITMKKEYLWLVQRKALRHSASVAAASGTNLPLCSRKVQELHSHSSFRNIVFPDHNTIFQCIMQRSRSIVSLPRTLSSTSSAALPQCNPQWLSRLFSCHCTLEGDDMLTAYKTIFRYKSSHFSS